MGGSNDVGGSVIKRAIFLIICFIWLNQRKKIFSFFFFFPKKAKLQFLKGGGEKASFNVLSDLTRIRFFGSSA